MLNILFLRLLTGYTLIARTAVFAMGPPGCMNGKLKLQDQMVVQCMDNLWIKICEESYFSTTCEDAEDSDSPATNERETECNCTEDAQCIRPSDCNPSITTVTHSISYSYNQCPTPSQTMSSSTTPAPLSQITSTSMPSGYTTLPSGTCMPCDKARTDGSTAALGAFTGMLLALLVAVVIGWICTCVVLKKRSAFTPKQSLQHTALHNPVYDSESIQRNLDNPSYVATAQPQTNYSSLGPAYELVDANEEAGHSYDVINQRGGRQVTRPQNTPPRSHEQNYNVLDHTGRPDRHDNQVNESNQQENVYHVLEQSNEPSIDPEDHDYFVLENDGSGPKGGPKGAPNVQGGGEHIDSAPLDYEVPNQIPREAEGGREGEYLKLKH